MKTKEEVIIELAQTLKGYQNNLTRILEHPMWKDPCLSIENKGKKFQI
jgi:hypothetical protein